MLKLRFQNVIQTCSRARMLLRKKKYQENLLQTTDQQLENLEKLTSDLEFAQIEQRVLDGLKIGNDALKKVHEILTIDEVERILDETNEGVEKQREIDAMINQYGESSLTDEDEEAVLAELEQLVADEQPTKSQPNTDVEIELPEVPADALPSVDKVLPEKRKKTKAEPIALEAA